jgi:hypothetical protein
MGKQIEPLTPAERAWWQVKSLRDELNKKLNGILMELEPHLPKQRQVVTRNPDELVDPVTGKVYPIKRRG